MKQKINQYLFIFMQTVFLVGVVLLLGGCSPNPQNSLYLLSGPTPILVFGDSLSYGYDLDESERWSNLLETTLRDEGYLKPDQHIANYSKNGETTEDGRKRFLWALDETDPHVVVIELGGNDALRRLSMKEMENNLDWMITEAQKREIRVLLVGVDLPAKFFFVPTKTFTSVYKNLADKHSDVLLVDNIMRGVNSDGDKMLGDGIHPNALGHITMAETMKKPLIEMGYR